MSTCKGCDAPIRFVKSERGNTMCLNAAPDYERGNVLIVERADRTYMARVLPKERAARSRAMGADLYLSHHATCPRAADFTRQHHQRRPGHDGRGVRGGAAHGGDGAGADGSSR